MLQGTSPSKTRSYAAATRPSFEQECEKDLDDDNNGGDDESDRWE